MKIKKYYASQISSRGTPTETITLNTIDDLIDLIHKEGSVILYYTALEEIELCVYDDYVE